MKIPSNPQYLKAIPQPMARVIGKIPAHSYKDDELIARQLMEEEMRANNDMIYAQKLQEEEDTRIRRDIFERDFEIARRFESDAEAARLQSERVVAEEGRLFEDSELPRKIAEADKNFIPDLLLLYGPSQGYSAVLSICRNCAKALVKEQSLHKDVTGEKYQELKRNNDTDDEQMEEFLRQGDDDPEGEFRMRRCPKCRMAFMKDKACVHVVCLPLGGGCGAHFCFRCANYWADDATSIYNHQGTCPGFHEEYVKEPRKNDKTLRSVLDNPKKNTVNLVDEQILHRPIVGMRNPPPKVQPPPSWVSVVFASASSESSLKSSACDFRVADAKETMHGRSLVILESSVSYRRVLLEYDEKELLQAMSANFIFIQLPDKSPGLLDREIQQLKAKLKLADFTAKTGQSELWIETCPYYKGIGALHFSSEKIEFFYAILRVAGELNLKPFPDCCMLGLSNCARLNQWTDSLTSPCGIQVPVEDYSPSINGHSKIKVGVIERGFYKDDDLPNAIFHQDPNLYLASSAQRVHGIHVAGIIDATANAMVIADHIELHLYTLTTSIIEIEPNSALPPQILHWLSIIQPNPFLCELFNCFGQCKEEKVSLVNISMEWYDSFQKNYIVSTLDAAKGIMESDSWDCHFIIAAGNNNRYLDSYQTNQPGPPEQRIHVDVFSALTNLLPDRISLISASDVFGHHCSFSNYGSMVAMAAPGEEIISTSYGFETGTSQSAPLVTAAIAIMKLRYPDKSNIEIIQHFKSTADIHFTLLGKCSASGRLNLGRALGLPRNLISEDKWGAYSARSKVLVAYDEKIFEIMDSMPVIQLLEWYDRLSADNSDGHGKCVLNVISCAHLYKAIDSFHTVDDQERIVQMSLIVARLKELAGQEQYPSIQRRLEDVAYQFEQQATQLPLTLSDWRHGLMEQLCVDPAQAMSEWQHPYPLPPMQPQRQDNLLLSDLVNQLANITSNPTELILYLAAALQPPVEGREQLEELIVQHAPPDLQPRLSEWLRDANVTIAWEQIPSVQNDFKGNHHELLRRAYNVAVPAPRSTEWFNQLTVMLSQPAEHVGPVEVAAQQEHNTHFQEWRRLLHSQLENVLPTAFLRDMARRRILRIEPLWQLMDFFIGRNRYDRFVDIFGYLESEAAIAQLNSPSAMLPIWEYEKKFRGLHHGVLYVLRCGLGGESNNVMMLNAKGNISTALMQLLGLAVILPASIAQLREKFCPLN
eukprot:gene22941-29718_t